MPDWFDQHSDILGPNAGATAGPAVQPQVYEQGGITGAGPLAVDQLAGVPGGTAQGTPAAGGAPAGGGQFSYDAFAKRAGELSQGSSGTLREFQQRILPQLQQEFPGIQGFGSKGDKIRLPNGQTIDAVVSAGLGGKGYNWGIETPGGGAAGAPAGDVASMGALGWSGLGPSGAQAALPRDLGSVTQKELTASKDFTPTNVAGPDKLTLGSINQPGAVTPQTVAGQTVAGPEKVTADQVQGPAALGARNVNDPTGFQNLTADQLQQDPSYQFRLSQGLGALQNSAAARGFLNTGATGKALMDYAGQSASQEYQAANERARTTYQQNLGNQQSVIGQNNAAQAQAYGLTNQYQQQAALANQAANLGAQQFNVQAGQQAGQFNAGQLQQAALANQGANLQAGQFNAGMDYNTQAQNIQNQLAAYNAYQPLQQQNQQFNAAQQASAAQQNFANRFNVEQANNANQLGAFNANTNAALGLGQLNLGAAQAANSYNLGLGNLSLGNKQADQSYNLGLGNLGVSQGYLGLAGDQQGFNQGLQTFNTNYGVYQNNQNTAFNQAMAQAQLGYGAASQYGQGAAGLYSGQGNANAAAGMAGANAWTGALGNIGNAAQQAGYYYATQPQSGGGGGNYFQPSSAGGYVPQFPTGYK